jgi:hypothetical protein
MNSTTQAQQFAAAYAADMASQMLKTIKRVRQAATAIMVIAMVVSYTHQAGYLAGIGTPALGAWLIPGALDALTFLCVKVLGTPGMAQPAKKMALRVLVFPVVASGSINFMGPGAMVTKIVFVLAVLLIPAAELVASKIKPDFRAMDAMERDMAPATEVSDEERARRSESAKKAAATRKRNATVAKVKSSRTPRAPKAARSPVEEIEALEGLAPVSPAVM